MTWCTAKFGAQKCLYEIPSNLWPDCSPTHTQDIHVVILDTLLGREMIVNETCANAFQFVGAHGGADTAAANRHAPVYFARSNCLRQRYYEIRVIVVSRKLVRSKINNLVPPGENSRDEFLLQREPAVIRGYADVHDSFLSSSLAQRRSGRLIGKHHRLFAANPASWN
jgi:hypothetical protein